VIVSGKKEISEKAMRRSSPLGHYAGFLIAGCQDTEYSSRERRDFLVFSRDRRGLMNSPILGKAKVILFLFVCSVFLHSCAINRSGGCDAKQGIYDPVFFDRKRPILFAHRGGAMEVAESTRRGFRHAIAVDADVLELDVHALDVNESGKREFVVWHGPELSNVRIDSLPGLKATHPGRRTKSENDIRHWNWEDLKGKAWVADPEIWHDENGEKKPACEIDVSLVPKDDDRLLMTLSELLEEFPDSHLNIEMKDSFHLGDVKQLVDLLDSHRKKRTILVVSLNPILIEAFRIRSCDRYPTGFSVLGVAAAWLGEKLRLDLIPDMHNHRALQTTYHPKFTPRSLICDVQERHGAVHVFLTSFTKKAPAIDAEKGRPAKDELFEILNRGVDGVMTDRPEHVRKLMNMWIEEVDKRPEVSLQAPGS
jgi:glycerophosphoryl diester phosphodiesterase